MLHSQIIAPAVELAQKNAPSITYGSAAASGLFLGLHIGDFAALVSSFAAMGGLFLQVYVAMRRIKAVEKDMAANNLVTIAQAQATRVINDKVDTLTSETK